VLRVLTVAAVILPLAIDTFILGTALGAAGIAGRDRLRTSLILGGFESMMPVAGFLVGAGFGAAVGRWAEYLAALVLAAVGAWMLRPGAADDEPAEDRVRLLQAARGWAILVLGLSISLDELAIGFGIGLLGLPLVVLVVLIGAQAILAAQAGMRLGSRIAERARHLAERLAGTLLIIAAGLVLAERLVA
jgi:putative Mn2+ efflux pump MntP